MNKCLERVNDRHFWNPGVFSYAMITKCRPNSRVFFHRHIYTVAYVCSRNWKLSVNWLSEGKFCHCSAVIFLILRIWEFNLLQARWTSTNHRTLISNPHISRKCEWTICRKNCSPPRLSTYHTTILHVRIPLEIKLRGYAADYYHYLLMYLLCSFQFNGHLKRKEGLKFNTKLKMKRPFR